MDSQIKFSTDCRLCPRLANFLDEVRLAQPDYFARPVPSFGDAQARLLIVGLAPGMHGANRTGRPFTGDFAGNLLYSTLHRFGFSSHAMPLNAANNANAELSLSDCRITNAVRCLPPQNKPEPAEVKQCNGYLTAELAGLPQGAAVLALGTVAHLAVLRALGLRAKDYGFAHGATHALPGRVLKNVASDDRSRREMEKKRSLQAVYRYATPHFEPLSNTAKSSAVVLQRPALMLYDSYHCSRYNTQTKRLNEAMFHNVFSAITGYLSTLEPRFSIRKFNWLPPLEKGDRGGF